MDAQIRCWEGLGRASGLPSIATVSMGWDAEPWHGEKARPAWQLSPDQFGQLCEQAKQYATSLEGKGLAGRMVLLDNWNEFGEGHYLFPHREYGFGYLDAVRRAFAPQAPPHRDVTPRDLGLGPYDGMHREHREFVRRLQGWDSPHSATELELTERGLQITAAQNDPQIICRELPAVAGELVLTVRMKSTGAGTPTAFWTTATEPRFSASRRAAADVAAKGEWIDWTVRFEAQSPLAGLRIDPSGMPGNVWIEAIRLEEASGQPVKMWKFIPTPDGIR